MSRLGASGPGDADAAVCAPDGPIDAGRAVVDAVECRSARFVSLTHDTGVAPTYLVLTAADGAGTQLSSTDVLAMPEVQNALAYFGPETESVRVQTEKQRRDTVRDHVDALRDGAGAFEFAGRQFDLDVVVG